jgi:hypothetical protein
MTGLRTRWEPFVTVEASSSDLEQEEATMRHLFLLSVAAGLIVSAALSLANAQTTSPDPSAQQGPNTPQDSQSSTHPGHMGATGWSGGRKDADGPSDAGTTGTNSGGINSDTKYSTGEDLKGPPAQYPGGKTPE